MTDLNWQDPPEPKSGGRKSGFTTDVRDALRARPEVWALIRESGLASQATRWRTMHGREGFEFTARRVEGSTNRSDIYARYVPEAER